MRIVTRRQGGFTLLEVMIVLAIIGVILAIGAPELMRYLLRAKAAEVIVDSAPIIRAIQEYQGTIDKNQFRMQLVNGADGSISGCQAPVGSTCAAAGTAPVVIVRPELTLITDGTIRVSAALCFIDCPSFALNFSSDVNLVPATPAAPATPASPATPAAPATPTPPAAPAESVPATPGQDTGKGKGGGGKGDDKGKGKQSAQEEWPGRRILSEVSMSLVPSAHAAEAGGSFTQINRVLYEFGEIMRKRVYAADNAACLFSTGTCTVTIKY